MSCIILLHKYRFANKKHFYLRKKYIKMQKKININKIICYLNTFDILFILGCYSKNYRLVSIKTHLITVLQNNLFVNYDLIFIE